MADQDLPQFPVEVSTLDPVQMGVYPIDPAGIIVQGEAIGPAQVCVDEDLPLRTVQVRPFDLGNVAPVCPEEVPLPGEKQWPGAHPGYC